MAWTPDGRLFVCEKGGALRVVKNGALLAAPFLTLSVTTDGERGLLGVAVDPNYASNGRVYVYYADSSGNTNKVSRFVASTSNPDVRDSSIAEQVLLSFPMTAGYHNGGAIHFHPTDGMLYLGVGDAHSGESAGSVSDAQKLSVLDGKMLRINTDGSIPAGNPTSFQGIAGTLSGPTAIWAVGLRNPFTFNFQPTTGRMFINDVGQGTWEEINDGVMGKNYGWAGQFPSDTDGPRNMPGTFTDPIHYYGHTAVFASTPTACAITGGTFYNPTNVMFPASYVGKYFFSDYCGNWIAYIDPASPSTRTQFATGVMGGPVDLSVGPDGALYYSAQNANAIGRIYYNQSIVVSSNTLTLAEGGTGTFTVQLSAMPASTVTVNVTRSAGNSNITAAPTPLTFTTGNWNSPQTVTVSSVATPDGVDDTATITCSASGLASANVAVTATDPGVQSIILSKSSLTIAEGGSGTFGVHLAIAPASTVTVNVARSAGNTNITAGPTPLTFTSANFATNQTVTVNSVATPDGVNDTATITCSSAGVTSVNVAVTATDTGVPNAPTIAIAKPSNGDVVRGKNQDFFSTDPTVVAPATPTKAEFYIDGVLKYTDPYNSGAGHFHFGGGHLLWDTTVLSDGFHTLTIKVYDSAGRSGGSPPVVVYVANVTPVHQQQNGGDGVVAVEAENYSARVPASDGHHWVVDTSFAGFSGSSAMRAMPDTGTNYTGPGGYSSISPRLDYVINFTTTGTHYVWVRGIGPSGAGNDDSCHVGLDGAETASAERISSFGTGWTWSDMTMVPSVATLNIPTIGPHIVNVWMREDGFGFDKLVLTTNVAYPTPTGNGPAESANIGGSGGGGVSAIQAGCGITGLEVIFVLGVAALLRRKTR